MTPEQADYIRRQVTDRRTILPRLIEAEEKLAISDSPSMLADATEQEKHDMRETARKRAEAYRAELSLAESVLTALDHPEPAHNRFCMRHGHAHPDTGSRECQWQEGT